MKRFVLLCVIVAVMWLQLPTPGDAVCCRTHRQVFRLFEVCGDCHRGTPYCSSTGTCNVFGCNCDGGCRTGKCDKWYKYNGIGKREVSTRIEDAHDVIRAADVDGDGRMSVEEARVHLGLPVHRVRRSLMELDTDNDDFLSAHEIDRKCIR